MAGDDWQPEIDELRRPRGRARARWAARPRSQRHHDPGKLTVRERIDALLDPGSFHEIGALAGKATY